ncbi:type III secretion system (T3SS) inner membrane Yop/YscD-like protein [Prosthecobacter fusiformis]|uniref:Type III secretion system (T3SS) inner membrane Yop/YscD-like protein n=1 Tax=Prosthecobacter fusiformis TaxID=48464 RepID=A0A4R7RZW7_9BACT|nr:FHA domain-containing protein [Prosthecobacter fusiformis]TDU70706.1 type III secretion system (T3SS) inner membrane Yop/YscD-like protein [Prosthecobacter fusiformis]
MSAASQQWLLKVIAGPHQGAEIGLLGGKTLIGSDGECDVVLHDVLIAPQHVELDLSASGMVAAALGGRIFINGKRVREASHKLPDFAFLTIGGSHLVLGPVGGTWPLLSAADIPELEKETEAPAAEESPPETAEPTVNAAASSGLKPIIADGETYLPRPQPTSKLGPILGIVAGVVVLLVWAVVFNDFFSSHDGNGDNNSDVSDRPLVRAQSIVEELGLLGSIKIEEAAGRLTAAGYVDSESKQRELQAALRATVPGLRTKIYSLEKIASSARALIDAQHLPLTVSSLSEGKLKISGKLPSADPWMRMRKLLLSEVPGVSEIEDSVEIEATRPAASNTVYVSLPPFTSGAPNAPTPPAANPLPTSSIPPSNPISAQTSAPLPDPVTDYLISADTIDTPEAAISTIRVDEAGLSYVRLSTGGVYFVGARLPYGGTVAKIEAESVTIIEKGESRSLHQGDVAMKSKSLAAP